MDMRNHKRRNGLMHARVNFSQSATRSLPLGGKGVSYRLCEGLESSWSRLELDASLLPADSISVRLAIRAHSSSTLWSIGSIGSLILPSTDIKVSSTSGVSLNEGSISVSYIGLSSIVSQELSNVCVPVSVSSLINWEKIRRYWNIEFCWRLSYSELIIRQGV